MLDGKYVVKIQHHYFFFTIWIHGYLFFFRCGSNIWVSHQKRYIYSRTLGYSLENPTGKWVFDFWQSPERVVDGTGCVLYTASSSPFLCEISLDHWDRAKKTQSDWSAVYFYFYNFLLALPWSDLKQGRWFLDFKGSTHKQGPYSGSWGRNNRGDLRRSNPYVMPQHVDCW